MLQLFKSAQKLMGNRFEITVVAEDADFAHSQIQTAISEIQRIEALLTTFSDSSETNAINQQAGIHPVRVSAETFALIARAQRISSLTQGAFDLSYGSLDKKLWNFDTNMQHLPAPATAREMVRLINYQNIQLDETNQTVFLTQKGMRIGFGGIGKGYAAEAAKRLLIANGITSGIVNAAGDLTAWGRQPNGQAWTVGIADPSQAQLAFAQFNISGLAIATSGDYEKFITIDGKRYSHTIDPKTGYPAQGLTSVSVIAPNAELADALTTPIIVMGREVGLHLINQMKNVACIIVDANQKIHTSNNINLH